MTDVNIVDQNSKQNFGQDLKKIKTIRNLGISEAVFSCTGVVAMIAWYILFFGTLFEDFNEEVPNPELDDKLFGQLFWIFPASLISSIAFVLRLTSSIMIFAVKWENKNVDDSKILWGLLSILVIGWIGILIFASKAKKSASIGG